MAHQADAFLFEILTVFMMSILQLQFFPFPLQWAYWKAQYSFLCNSYRFCGIHDIGILEALYLFPFAVFTVFMMGILESAVYISLCSSYRFYDRHIR